MTDVKQLLVRHFGFDSFRAGQEAVIGSLLDGHSAAAVFPTGGGKSLCYQLPSLEFEGMTLVVSPLIALMKDQIDALKRRGIAAARMDSTLSHAEYLDVVQAARSGELRLLYVAPERFSNERFRQLLESTRISLFAVDEAHCISEWGHHFRPDYLKLARIAEEVQAERVLALTATATPQVLEDICREFQIHPEHAERTEFYRENLRLLFTSTTSEKRDDELIAHLRGRPSGSAIVYVTLQKTAERIAELLREHGLAARHYHAGLDAENRQQTQDWFLQGEGNVIVATIAFGMGIDKSDIRYVYHYNLAKSIENYAQEIGRAGRDGNDAICETLAVVDDLRTLENFVYGDTPDEQDVANFVRELFSQGEQLSVSIYQLCAQHDIRDLVIRTLLTYLELDGFLSPGTPYFAEYKFQPLVSSTEMLTGFDTERQKFLSAIFKLARKGRTWFSLDIDECVSATKSDRQRVIRALDYLADRDQIRLQASRVHHRYEVRIRPDIEELTNELHRRLLSRQQRELGRLDAFLKFVTHDGCQVSALGGYFGEPLPQPCGHCSWCESEQPIRLTSSSKATISDDALATLQRVRQEHLEHLGAARAFARFACGLTSPRLVKAKLTRHKAFGLLADVPFKQVLALAAS